MNGTVILFLKMVIFCIWSVLIERNRWTELFSLSEWKKCYSKCRLVRTSYQYFRGPYYPYISDIKCCVPQPSLWEIFWSNRRWQDHSYAWNVRKTEEIFKAIYNRQNWRSASEEYFLVNRRIADSILLRVSVQIKANLCGNLHQLECRWKI